MAAANELKVNSNAIAPSDGIKVDTMGETNDEKSKIDQLLEHFVTLQAKVDEIKTDVKGLGDRFSLLEGRTTANESRITAAENKSKQLENNLDGVHRSVTVLDKTVKTVKESGEFISAKYDDLIKLANENKTSIDQLKLDCTGVSRENIALKTTIAGYKHELEQEKTARNTDAQYQRTSINLKLCGLPMQEGEEIQGGPPTNPVTKAVITRVCEAANITTGFDDIDVCHRLGNEQRSPIIIRFNSKSAQYSFYNQRAALKNISTLDVNFAELPTPTDYRERSSPHAIRGVRDGRGGGVAASGDSRSREPLVFGPNKTAHDVFIQEHLTKNTKTLLKDTKDALSTLDYAYVYVKDGSVRVKKYPNDKPTTIRCKDDIEKLVNNKNPS